MLAACLGVLGVAGCAAASGTRGPAAGPEGEVGAVGMDAARAAEGVREDSVAGPFAYVTNQDAATVSVIDMDENRVVEVVDLTELGFSPTAKPHDAAVEPDGSYWYVTLIGDGKVLKFDRTNELVGQVDTEVPGLIALHPYDDLMYVARSMSAVSPPASIAIIRRSDMTLEQEVDVFVPRPHAIVVDPRGGWVYVGSLAENRIAVVGEDGGIVELAPVEGPIHSLVQFAVSPDGETLVGGGELTGKLLVFDASSPPELRLMEQIDVPAGPWHPIFTEDGRYLWFGNQRADAVTVVDALDWTVDDVIRGPALAMPHGIAVRPDGAYVYVSNRNLRGSWHPGVAAAGHAPAGAGAGGEAGRGTGETAAETAAEGAAAAGADRTDGMAGMQGGGSGIPGNVVVIDAAERDIVDVLEIGLAPSGMGGPEPAPHMMRNPAEFPAGRGPAVEDPGGGR